jgi:hypothetical protein
MPKASANRYKVTLAVNTPDSIKRRSNAGVLFGTFL